MACTSTGATPPAPSPTTAKPAPSPSATSQCGATGEQSGAVQQLQYDCLRIEEHNNGDQGVTNDDCAAAASHYKQLLAQQNQAFMPSLYGLPDQPPACLRR